MDINKDSRKRCVLLLQILGIGRNVLYTRSLLSKETLLKILKLLMWHVFDCKTLPGMKSDIILWRHTAQLAQRPQLCSSLDERRCSEVNIV